MSRGLPLPEALGPPQFKPLLCLGRTLGPRQPQQQQATLARELFCVHNNGRPSRVRPNTADAHILQHNFNASHPATAAGAPQKHHLPFMVWNCGGLTAVRFKEIRHWISLNPPIIIVLLETFWKEDTGWFEPGRAGGMSFTLFSAEGFAALVQMPARKAVPPHYAPAALWKHSADLLADFVAPDASFPAGPVLAQASQDGMRIKKKLFLHQKKLF